MGDTFGIIIIGDEILSGHRRDTHFEAIGSLIRKRGYRVAWLRILPDDPEQLTDELRQIMSDSIPVFCCGGIGITPDDHTRACAAAAANVPLIRHTEAANEIEAQFGDDAYPVRIKMADFPEGASLIPNPINRVPGFSIDHTYFLPGFPSMAHPMAEWVLDNYYPNGTEGLRQRSVIIYGRTESSLMEIMHRLVDEYPQVKLFSLPHMGEDARVEVGFRGYGDLETPYAALVEYLQQNNISFKAMPENS